MYSSPGDGATLDQSFTRSPDVTWNSLDSETVLLNVATSQYYTINSTATTIWELFEAGRTLVTIIDTICENYEIHRSEIERDLLLFSHQLHSEGLLQINA